MVHRHRTKLLEKAAEEIPCTKIDRTLDENAEVRFEYFEKVKEDIQTKEKEIADLKKEFDAVENIPENSIKKSKLRVQIKTKEGELDELKTIASKELPYLYSLKKVVNHEIQTAKELGNPEEQVFIQAPMISNPHVGSKKSRKKKKSAFKHDEEFAFEDPLSILNIRKESSQSSLMLAQEQQEIPLEISDHDVCLRCGAPTEIRERPPSANCMECGLSVKIDLDNNSWTGPESKDNNPSSNPTTNHQAKIHFMSWVKKNLQGKCKKAPPKEIIDEVLASLALNGYDDLQNVTWKVVNNTLRELCKANKKFNKYYNQGYQILAIIRQQEIFKFTEEEEEEIFKCFDSFHMLWRINIEEIDQERNNSMYNALMLQIIFKYLEYPPDVINAFNSIKGDGNAKYYDVVIRKFCQSTGEEEFTTNDMELLQHGDKTELNRFLFGPQVDEPMEKQETSIEQNTESKKQEPQVQPLSKNMEDDDDIIEPPNKIQKIEVLDD